MKILAALLLLALCAGCSTTLVRETPRAVHMGAARVETAALVEALRTWRGTSVQAVNGAWRDQTFQAQCVMKGDGETLTVVFLAPQLRLVTITVTKPHTITCERAPQIPSAFEPEYALADLAFVNLDAATLRRAVGAALTVAEDGATRRIATPTGEGVAEVTRAADGTLRFRNLLHGYAYELKTIQ
ncbi:MAG: DUF3261 domain-containing protein [Kiritimatiellia bacterium]